MALLTHTKKPPLELAQRRLSQYEAANKMSPMRPRPKADEDAPNQLICCYGRWDRSPRALARRTSRTAAELLAFLPRRSDRFAGEMVFQPFRPCIDGPLQPLGLYIGETMLAAADRKPPRRATVTSGLPGAKRSLLVLRAVSRLLLA